MNTVLLVALVYVTKAYTNDTECMEAYNSTVGKFINDESAYIDKLKN